MIRHKEYCVRRYFALLHGIFAVWTTGAIISEPAVAQSSEQNIARQGISPSDIPDNCLPAQKIQFVLSGTRINIDARWLGNKTLILLYYWVSGPNCPTWPVTVESIEFEDGALNAMHFTDEIDRKTFRLRLSGIAFPGVNSPPVTSASPGDDFLKSNGPSIESLAVELRQGRSVLPGVPNIQFRAYRLHYQSGIDGGDTAIDVGCGGHVQHRICETYHDYFYGGVYVAYKLSPDQARALDAAKHDVPDPNSEPAVLLEFDKRLRSWIVSLKQAS
jgi:hypothetical protein